MSWKPVDPKDEVERLLKQVQYERSNLFAEKQLLEKIKRLLTDRAPKNVESLWYSLVPYENGSIIAEKGFAYSYEIKGTAVTFYQVTNREAVIVSVEQFVGTKKFVRTAIISEKETYEDLKALLEDQEEEKKERDKYIENVLDELLDDSND